MTEEMFMDSKKIDKAGLVALAAQCERRASELGHEADVTALETDAVEAVCDAEFARYEASKSQDSTFRWLTFQRRRDELAASVAKTREDVTHYQECAAALRSIAAGQP